MCVSVCGGGCGRPHAALGEDMGRREKVERARGKPAVLAGVLSYHSFPSTPQTL